MKITIKVAAVIKNKSNKFLFIKERYDLKDGFKWNWVKGTLNKRELPEDGIKREVLEEVGLLVKKVSLKSVVTYGDNKNLKILFIFLVNDFKGKAKIADNKKQAKYGEEIIDFAWFSKDKIKKIPKKDFMSPYIRPSVLV